ncbi:hypothetical protein MSG28_003445 [Choristoneura fumiferana]|uniref:Uncharacterized protein n=1 Tax=Choristoneura fumiferana TaxID=7141 RepID=A0ACC0KES5_CHOFU|nr:hypothetical protein MSG28_003445 [Choristoneura fumiferana]
MKPDLMMELEGGPKDLVVGTSYSNRLVWRIKANHLPFPFRKRVKEYFYSSPDQQLIRGIVVIDLDRSEAVPSITAGGIGFPYVNIKLKSARGTGLNYQLEVYN